MALGELPDYPWDLMAPYVARAGRAEPFGDTSGVVDLSIGSPVDPTPEVIRRALADATDAHAYPQTVGTPALREAIVAWFERRRGVPGLATENVLPTIGSKELVAFLPFFLGLGEGDAVVHPRAAYPTYAIGAALAGAQSVAADDPADWPTNTRLVWLNSPGNPDGRVLSAVELAAAVSRARELGAVVASDECYAELGWEGPWHDEPIPSVLDPRVIGDDRTDVLAVYSLSKQSNLAGYRAAFIAGDPRLIARLTTVRKHAGLMLPSPLQAAMVAPRSRPGGRRLPHRPQRGGPLPVGDRRARRLGEHRPARRPRNRRRPGRFLRGALPAARAALAHGDGRADRGRGLPVARVWRDSLTIGQLLCAMRQLPHGLARLYQHGFSAALTRTAREASRKPHQEAL